MSRVIIRRCLLQQILDRKDLTQTEFSAKVGISKSHISEYVNLERMMTMKTAMLISSVLNVDIDDLYEFKVK